MTTVSFPGLGIKEFTMDKTAFSLFGKFDIQWYAILITAGIFLSLFYAMWRAKQQGISTDDFLDIAMFTIPLAIIGARCGYVLFSLDDYLKFMDTEGFFGMLGHMVNIREGGLQIYGAITVGAATIFGVCKFKKISILKALDAIGPAVMIGQMIGRWGNFVNGEAHGAIVSEGSPLYFLRMGLTPYHMDGKLNFGYAEVHPTFLYESLWNLVGFIIINFFYKKKKFDGQLVLMYLSWYGFGRMLIEMLRTDSLYIGNTGIRISVAIGALCFIGGVTLLIIGFVRSSKKSHNAVVLATSEGGFDASDETPSDKSEDSTLEAEAVSEDEGEAVEEEADGGEQEGCDCEQEADSSEQGE